MADPSCVHQFWSQVTFFASKEHSTCRKRSIFKTHVRKTTKKRKGRKNERNNRVSEQIYLCKQTIRYCFSLSSKGTEADKLLRFEDIDVVEGKI